GNRVRKLSTSAGASLARTGVLSQVASGGGWKTTITLINTSTSPVSVRVSFYADDGTPLNVPYTGSQQGVPVAANGSTIDQLINPSATLVIDTEAPATSATLVGWAEVLSSGPVSGFGVFRQRSANGRDSEGTSPLETRSSSNLVLPYDNTAGFA